MTFGARLKEERRRLGLKQAEFADLVGTDVPKQSLYENGTPASFADPYLEGVDGRGRRGLRHHRPAKLGAAPRATRRPPSSPPGWAFRPGLARPWSGS